MKTLNTETLVTSSVPFVVFFSPCAGIGKIEHDVKYLHVITLGCGYTGCKNDATNGHTSMFTIILMTRVFTVYVTVSVIHIH